MTRGQQQVKKALNLLSASVSYLFEQPVIASRPQSIPIGELHPNDVVVDLPVGGEARG